MKYTLKKFTKIEIIRSIVCIPFFPAVVFVGILINDLTGILDYYYPIFTR